MSKIMLAYFADLSFASVPLFFAQNDKNTLLRRNTRRCFSNNTHVDVYYESVPPGEYRESDFVSCSTLVIIFRYLLTLNLYILIRH